MEGQTSEKRFFPHADYEHFRHFYPFGNTPAEDLLQSVSVTDCREPTVLSLGCGDMRSPMFTIFKHFGFEDEVANRFAGIEFVLNDRSAAVLARNILFLYICTTMSECADRKEWIASIWSLWYNHELQAHHKNILDRAVDNLIEWSSSWEHWSQCPIGKVVYFSSPATFAKVKVIWASWKSFSRKIVPDIKSEREKFQIYHLQAMDVKITDREQGLQIRANIDQLKNPTHSVMHSPETVSKMVNDNLNYLRGGTVWIEPILGISASFEETFANPTLFERADGIYNLHYSLTPYKGFNSSFYYTCAEVRTTFERESAALKLLPVADHHFGSQPQQANAVQQFAMWLPAMANALKGEKVSFTFHIGDSVEFCCTLHYHPTNYSKIPKMFDAIYTSNLIDYIWPPLLVFNTLPLLKPIGTLFTTTLNTVVTDNREFLERTFGFSPE